MSREQIFVAHDCRNSKQPEYLITNKNGKRVLVPNPNYCNNRWIDIDITKATAIIPNWKYCRECCEKLGIDFEKQKPSDYRSDEQNKSIKERIKKMQDKKKLKH